MTDGFTKLQCLFRLVTLLQTGDGGNAAHLAAKFNVVPRTIYRYLHDLNELGVPCYFDEEADCYRIRKDFFLPPLHLTASETLALTFLVERVAGQEQIALTGPAAQALEKIRARLPDKVLKEIGEVDDHIAVQLLPTGPAGDAIKDVFEPIREAIATRRAVRCRYESLNPDSDSNETFLFKPYKLFFDHRSWYAIGDHAGRGEVRRLKLNRFISIEATDHPYEIPQDFTLESYRGKAWRMIRGEATFNVVIHFDAMMAETVSDTHWHPTQEIEDHEDDSITFRCEVDGLEEIVWWVMGYGPGAQVIEPRELADKVAMLARETAKKYEDGQR